MTTRLGETWWVSASWQDDGGRPGLTWPGVAPLLLYAALFPVPSIPPLGAICLWHEKTRSKKKGKKDKERRHFDCSCWPTSTIYFRRIVETATKSGGASDAGGKPPCIPRVRFPARSGRIEEVTVETRLRFAGPDNSTHISSITAKGSETCGEIATHLVPKSVYGGDVLAGNVNMGKTVRTAGPRCVLQEGGKGRRAGLTWMNKQASSSSQVKEECKLMCSAIQLQAASCRLQAATSSRRSLKMSVF